MADRSNEYGIEITPERYYAASDLRIAFGFDQAELNSELKSGRLKSITRAGAVLVRGSDVLDWLKT
jgi:hypothetical protein